MDTKQQGNKTANKHESNKVKHAKDKTRTHAILNVLDVKPTHDPVPFAHVHTELIALPKKQGKVQTVRTDRILIGDDSVGTTRIIASGDKQRELLDLKGEEVDVMPIEHVRKPSPKFLSKAQIAKQAMLDQYFSIK